MMRTFRYAFVLAKIYGILRHSFVGENYRDILRLRSLNDLYDRLYPRARGEAPEGQLTVELERRVLAEGIRTMVAVLDLLVEPHPILVHLLRRFEYLTVKSALRTIVHGLASEPVDWDLGRWDSFQRSEGESWEDAIQGSPYAWVLPLAKNESLLAAENALDKEYYERLLHLARELPARDRIGVQKLVLLEATLTNVAWAMRLRFFFGMDAEHAASFMIPGLADATRRAVAQIFDIPADSVEGWRAWRYGWVLEDQLSESFQAPDPVRIEEQVMRRLYTRARQLFHQDPFTLTPIVAFFRLKEYEANMLATAVEALRLGVGADEVLGLAGLA